MSRVKPGPLRYLLPRCVVSKRNCGSIVVPCFNPLKYIAFPKFFVSGRYIIQAATLLTVDAGLKGQSGAGCRGG